MARRVIVIPMFPVLLDTYMAEYRGETSYAEMEGATKTACHDCGEECWIGPALRKTYETHDGPTALLCIYCIMTNHGGQTVITLEAGERLKNRPQP